MKVSRNLRSRRAVSEVVASVLAIALTIVAGTVAFAYENQQAAINEQSLGGASQNVVNTLQETFVPFNLNFTNTGGKVSVWIYNSGPNTFYPIVFNIYNGTKSLNVMWNGSEAINMNNVASCHPSVSSYVSQPIYNPTLNSQPSNVFGIAKGGIAFITLSLPCSLGWRTAGTSYFLVVTGRFGNSMAFSQFG